MTLTTSETAAPTTDTVAPKAVRQRPLRDIRPGETDELVSLLASASLMLALLCVWFLVQVLVLGGVSEDRAQHLLYTKYRGELAAETAPTGPVVKPGRPVALISVPALGISQVVVEGTASGDLLAGPGHRRDTALPGQQGVSLVYSRGGTYGAPLSGVDSLHAGDRIDVTTGQGRLGYTVVDVRHAGDPVPAYPTGTQSRLTITTTTGEGPLSNLRADSVVSVDAEAAKGFPAPDGRPTSVPPSEQAMATDTGALPVLVLALALLLGCSLVVSAARRRWSAAVVWVVTTPVVLALAWFTTEAAMRMLPNLM